MSTSSETIRKRKARRCNVVAPATEAAIKTTREEIMRGLFPVFPTLPQALNCTPRSVYNYMKSGLRFVEIAGVRHTTVAWIRDFFLTRNAPQRNDLPGGPA